LPVLATTGVRTNVVHHFADNWLLGLDEAKSARGEIHACRRVDVNEWRRRQHLAGQPVEYVEVAIAAGTGRDLARLAIDGEIEQQALIDRVVIKQIMRTLLVKPARLTGIGVTSKDAGGPFVIARTLRRVPGARVRSAIDKEIGF